MATFTKTTSQAEAELRKHVRILAVAAGVLASCAVVIPQLMPRRLDGFASGLEAMGVFLSFTFLTFLAGVVTPIYAYSRAVKIGVRTPAAAFAPLALLLSAIVVMVIIGQLRQRMKEVEFRPAPERPAYTIPVE